MILLSDIKSVSKGENGGYVISFFNTEKTIILSKKRTTVGLLLLIKYEICTEEDLTGTNGRLLAVKQELAGKIPDDLIKDRYGDANKPFSELWTEEMFSFIHAEGIKGNRQYVLRKEDHDKLFESTKKAVRVTITPSVKAAILKKQNHRCNICGALLRESSEISEHTFAKDRVRIEIDHRIPVDRGGESIPSNYQALCHYCNKCKRQMCYLCNKKTCDNTCALVNPEDYSIVIATGEDISDRKKSK